MLDNAWVNKMVMSKMSEKAFEAHIDELEDTNRVSRIKARELCRKFCDVRRKALEQYDSKWVEDKAESEIS